MAVELSQLIAENPLPLKSTALSGTRDVGIKGDMKKSQLPTDENILLHELQLGGQLNQSVVETRRADFSLMLAMLTEDVREQSQFILPKTVADPSTEQSNSELRKALHLPEETALSLVTLDDVKLFNQAQLVADDSFTSIQLNNALNPQPLAFRDDKQFISTQVMSNTSVTCQLKYKKAQADFMQHRSKEELESTAPTGATLNTPLNFNAPAWLNSVEESLVNAPLMS